MAEPKSRTIDSMKFMWDGVGYETVAEATEALEKYREEGFEARLVEEGEEVCVYTRKVVAEVVVEGEPPM